MMAPIPGVRAEQEREAARWAYQHNSSVSCCPVLSLCCSGGADFHRPDAKGFSRHCSSSCIFLQSLDGPTGVSELQSPGSGGLSQALQHLMQPGTSKREHAVAPCRSRRVWEAAAAKGGDQQQLNDGRGAISIQVVASGSIPANR